MSNRIYSYTGRIFLIFQWLKSKRLMFLLILAVFLVTTASCSDNSSSISSDIPFFTAQKPAREQMLAELKGELVLENGCLRVIDENNTSWLLIWPYGFSLRVDGEELQIINDKGQVVAHVGDYIYFGGGEVALPEEEAREHIEKNITGQKLPDSCNGPYWIVGETE